MTAKLAEKRRDNRVHTALPVSLENATGITRDMNASGAFFWLSGTYAIGESISFALEIKPARGRMMWTCRGVVVGTESRGNEVGVAVKITGTGVGSM
ncbi:MAG: PilZ domain-containing protein [Gammaproteobacteria bacterium]|nr:PilZ domain-containing protein [Gammaproteobacteria bacterium]